MTARWYVVKTESRAEYIAANFLEREGHEVFLPKVMSAQPRHGHIDTPLFPGYLFIRCDPDTEGWPSFHSYHRVMGWLNFGGDVPSLPDNVVEDLKELANSTNEMGGMWNQFRPGDRVELVSQTIGGLAEIVSEIKSPQGRAKVLLEFMGRAVMADVPWEILRPVGEGQDKYQFQVRRTRGKGRRIRRPIPSPTMGR